MSQVAAIILSNLPAAIFLIAGIALVAIEMFLPGFGAPGIAGLVCLVVGVVWGAGSSAVAALVLILFVIVVLGVLLFFSLRSASRGRIARTALVLKETTSAEAGFTGVENLGCLLGREGRALSALRPAGAAQFDGQRVDVVADGEFIRSGETIQVTQVEGRRIVVRSLSMLNQ